MRAIVLSAALLSLAATSAWSQETVSTAQAGDAHPPGAEAITSPLTDRLARERGDTTEIIADRCGGVSQADGGAAGADTHPHGEVSVGVGTGGYRNVSGYVCKPLADGGSIAIGGGETQDQGVRWGRR